MVELIGFIIAIVATVVCIIAAVMNARSGNWLVAAAMACLAFADLVSALNYLTSM